MGREKEAHTHEKDCSIDKKSAFSMLEYHDVCVNFSLISLKMEFWISA